MYVCILVHIIIKNNITLCFFPPFFCIECSLIYIIEVKCTSSFFETFWKHAVPDNLYEQSMLKQS